MPKGIRGFQKGVGVFTGHKHTEESKKKISDTKTGSNIGENNPNWKGGKLNWKKFKYPIKYNSQKNKERYKNLSEEKRIKLSWSKNKRNRLKQSTIKEFGSHTYGEWELLKKQYNYTCPCCKLSEPFNQKSKYLTEDHIIPLSKGGSDLIENIQPLCLNCNIKKHTSIIKY